MVIVSAVLLFIVVPGVAIVSLQPEPLRTLGYIILGFLAALAVATRVVLARQPNDHRV